MRTGATKIILGIGQRLSQLRNVPRSAGEHWPVTFFSEGFARFTAFRFQQLGLCLAASALCWKVTRLSSHYHYRAEKRQHSMWGCYQLFVESWDVSRQLAVDPGWQRVLKTFWSRHASGNARLNHLRLCVKSMAGRIWGTLGSTLSWDAILPSWADQNQRRMDVCTTTLVKYNLTWESYGSY